MWEWMYGGGVSVPGVATAGKAREKEDVDAARRGALVHQAFDEVPGARDCDVCEVPLVVDKQGREGRCPKGHVFGELKRHPPAWGFDSCACAASNVLSIYILVG